MTRLAGIDRLRGLVMALMALDHTRDFFLGFAPDPTDLAVASPALFATRWITHLCAPAFLLLAGMGAYLGAEARGAAAQRRFLLSRGLMLVALELTVVGFGWIPAPGSGLFLLQVIWAIGWAMVLLAALLSLSSRTIGLAGLALAALHPALSAALAALGAPEGPLALLLTAETVLDGPAGTRFIVSYPVLPWAAAMLIGYGLGPLAARDAWGRIAALGAAALVAFVALRLALGWDAGAADTDLLAALAFVNVEKYPPSPAYLALTLGAALLLLAAFSARDRGGDGVLVTLGRAPLFFYVLHLYALRIAGLVAAALVWGPENLGPPPARSAPEWPLWAVWLVWAAAMAALWPPTRWFARLKARRGGWLSWF